MHQQWKIESMFAFQPFDASNFIMPHALAVEYTSPVAFGAHWPNFLKGYLLVTWLEHYQSCSMANHNALYSLWWGL